MLVSTSAIGALLHNDPCFTGVSPWSASRMLCIDRWLLLIHYDHMCLAASCMAALLALCVGVVVWHGCCNWQR